VGGHRAKGINYYKHKHSFDIQNIMAQHTICKDITKLEWTVKLQRRIRDVTLAFR
jgi:hypothetical protein